MTYLNMFYFILKAKFLKFNYILNVNYIPIYREQIQLLGYSLSPQRSQFQILVPL